MSDAGTLDRDTKANARQPGAHFAGFSSAFMVGLILPLATALLYEAAFRLGLVQARLLPPPSRILATLWELAASGELATQVIATSLRVLSGFAIGSGVGMLLGAVTGSSAAARRFLDPTLQALRAIPSLAWVPLESPT